MTSGVKFFWVSLLYFAEGFPFGIVMKFFPIYFRDHLKMSLADIGLLSIAALPWTLKFLWAPLLDAAPNRRNWIIGCQLLMGIALFAFLLMPETNLLVIALLLCSMALFSATQDIAIDAYTIELLAPDEVGPANGLRVSFYRVALIAAGGWFVACADPTLSLGWKPVIAIAGGLLILLAVVSLFIPRFPSRACDRTVRGIVGHSMKRFLTTPGFLQVLLFVLVFKVGDQALDRMTGPFWVDRHFTPAEIGMVQGTIGVLCAVVGALVGGLFTKWVGVFHALWILGILQAGSNLVYVYTAGQKEPTLMLFSMTAVAEAFCGGLGTAPFLAFLMTICTKEYAATQYALLSALYALTGTIAGIFSGYVAASVGYSAYFALTALLALPAFALLPWVARVLRDRRENAGPAG